MIKAVIFDIDGVLLDSFEANLKFFSVLMKKYGFAEPTREAFRELVHLTMQNAIKSLTKLTSAEELKKIWQAAADKDQHPYPHEMLNVPKNLYEVVEDLSNKYALGIVTSRIRSSIFGMPQLAPLQKYFQAVVSYEDTENHKPHPAPLILCAEKLNLRPEECVYIGDTSTDVIAAKDAGMKIILYAKNSFVDADANTYRFNEIPGLVEKL
ncbi:MAG: HAD family hydrolase [Minisyncoccia bacterium]